MVTAKRSHRPTPLRQTQRFLILVILVYFFAGTVSQKLIPGVDEIFPLFGWSLFSKIPNQSRTYTVWIHEHDGRKLDPPLEFLRAPDAVVTGNRYIARKLIQRLGRAHEQGDMAAVAGLRQLFEANYLHGKVTYELRFERYQPLEKWRTGKSQDSRTLGQFVRGEVP